MKQYLYLSVLIFITIIAFMKPAPAAGQSFSLSINPPLTEILIKPGTSLTQTYQLANLTAKDMEVVATLVPFRPADEQGSLQLTLDKAFFDKSINWFSLEGNGRQLNTAFTLPAGQTGELFLKIRVPAEAEAKDHYYTLLIKNQPAVLTQGQTRTVIQGAVGANILMAVSPTQNLGLDWQISRFGLARSYLRPEWLDSWQTPAFLALVKNQSLHFTKVAGKITVFNNSGRPIGVLELMPHNVLAFGERQVVCKNSQDCQFNQRLFWGRLKAEITLDNGKEELKKSFYFLVFPFRLSALFLAGLGFSFLAYRYYHTLVKSPKSKVKS